jgi:predicted flap endonuclease-1-like 5' DNA nuclease
MVYLIAQLAAWLLLTAAFAALAGWAFAAYRSAEADAKVRRDRSNIVRDLGALVGEGAHPEESLELEREREASRRMAEVREGRVSELERALETARGNADEAQARAAELQRALDALEAEREAAPTIAVDAVPAPTPAPSEPEHDPALLTWRLRYFEQRVRYLEGAARAAAPLPEPEPEPAPAAPPLAEWRARVAEVRAAHAENEVRALMMTPPEHEAEQSEPQDEQASPFAANADVDVLLRWRMLYLERRVAHMQARAAAAPVALPEPVVETPPAEASPDSDRWKWRARYLEARARHLEQRLADAPAPAPVVTLAASAPEPEPEVEEEVAAPPPPTSSARRVKPPVLQAARHGAPDDFTLIEGVSLLQQTTLYSLGIFHYDQIAAWSDEHVAWIDNYLRLRGRIDHEEWREQAAALSRDGPAAARRMMAEESA